tara:strand:+ start:481 stop:633 length:153 start_codon:yes stop_codon:yes gene_type:complete
MPKYSVEIDFDGEVTKHEIERDSREEAEYWASRHLVLGKTSYSVDQIEPE